jgi:hypothetical protein
MLSRMNLKKNQKREIVKEENRDSFFAEKKNQIS